MYKKTKPSQSAAPRPPMGKSGKEFSAKFRFCPACGSSHFVENDFKSKRCEDCGFIYYFNAAAAVAVIITNEEGELLMCRRAQEPAKGTLDIIGGFVDPGESTTTAMMREMEEETGVHIEENLLTFLFSFPNTYLYSGLLIHTCDSFFHIELPKDTKFTPSDDVAECMWISPKDINLDDIGLDSIRGAVKRYISTLRF